MKAWIEARLVDGKFSNTSDYVRHLIRKDQERSQLRSLLLEGAESPVAAEADQSYFEGLRNRIRQIINIPRITPGHLTPRRIQHINTEDS